MSLARGLSTVTRVWRVLARPVLLRAIALGIAVGIPAFVISAGNGLRAVDVLAWLHRSLPVRGAFWAGWLVLSAPAMRLVFVAPGSVCLRALRLPRAPFLFALFTLCAAVQVPWGVLFVRGAGWGASLGAALLGWAVALGCVVAFWGRLLEQHSKRGTGTFVAGVTLIAVLATIGASAW